MLTGTITDVAYEPGAHIARMSAAPHQYAENRRRRDCEQELSRTHYRTMRATLYLTVLTRARAGTLTPHWRDSLALRPARHHATDAMFAADQLAVREVASTPPAAWEPHIGGGWRTALETWYATTRQAYATLDDIRHDTALAHHEQREPPAMPLPPVHRLHIEVWYRAGLAGGGEPVDWIAWLHGHGSDAARALLSRLEDQAVRDQIEHLPEYWN